MRIDGTTFLITGGGSGLGAATAKRLATDGANVVLADVDEEGGAAVAEQVGDQARFVSTDVTSADSVQGAVDTAVNEFGGLRGLINCAGVGPA